MNNKTIAAILTALVLAYGGYEWYGGEEPIYPGAPGDTWCASGWDKRIDINVNNTAGSALTDYQVYVNLTNNPINETSLRVYNATSCVIRLHWCENSTDGNCTKLWVNYSAIAASAWTNDTAIYYDNAAVSSASNITNTFLLGDEFSGSSLDTNKWTEELRGTGTSIVVADGECKLNVPDDQICSANIQSVNTFTNDIAIHVRRKCPDDNEYIEFSLGSGAITDTYSDQGYWWYTSKYSGYFTYISMVLGDSTSNEIYEVPNSGNKIALTDADASFTNTELNNYRTHQYVYDSSGNLKWYLLGESDLIPLGEGFEKYANNPLSIPDYSMEYGAVHPDMVYFPAGEDGYKYWLFYETVGSGPPVIEHLDLVRSNDGITFVDTGISNHILSPSAGGNWDDNYVADSSIVKIGSTWYMYYCGVNAGNEHRIGLATSSDGKSWSRITDGIDGTSKVLVPNTGLTEEAGDKFVSPAVYHDGTKFWMWYISKKAGAEYCMCLANSTDGKSWTKSVSNPVYEASGETIWHIDVSKHNGAYYCYFCHGSSGHLRLLKSTDKINWSLASNDPVLEYSEGWEGTHIYESGPAVDVNGDLVLIDDKMWMYYSTRGGTGDYYEIGLAKSWENIDVGSDDRLLANVTDTTFLNDDKKILVTQGAYSATGRGAPTFLDWAFVRKYASTEPSTTLGSEEQFAATAPVISNVLNGSISATSQWIDWDVNQTAHNRVVYDKGSAGADSTDCEGQWSATHACANASDGNWSSYAESAGALLAYAYFNYTVPTGASQVESLWRVKDSPGQANLTIPSACWGNTLYLRAMGSDTGNSITWQCDNGPGWTTLRTSVANIAYEQEMKFKYTSSWDNSTAAPNITLSGLIASTLYEYQVWSYNTTNTSLGDNSITLDFTTAAAETTPVISNVTNGYISPTSQWIDWDVNQTAHNRVTYGYTQATEDAQTCSGTWATGYECAKAYDGNWSSHAMASSGTVAYVYFNYSIPAGASQPTTQWHIKDGGVVAEHNLTIPAGCWNDPLYLRATSDHTGSHNVYWHCHNGSSWIELHNGADVRAVYEQEMLWYYWSSWDNSTALPNITLSSLTANTKYYFQAWSYNATNDALSANSSTFNFTTAAAANYITITGGNRALFCNWSSNTTFTNIATNLTNCTDFFYYNSTSQKWIFYNVNRTINANTVIHKHAAIFICFNNTTTVECDILAAETITIPSNVWYYTALRESASKTLTEINTAITADGCSILYSVPGGTALYAWNSTVGAYTNDGSYSVLPNEGLVVLCSTGCDWDGSI